MTAPTYTIRTVTDFLAVPDQRRADCLNEFSVWLGLLGGLRGLLGDLSEPVEFPDAFEWIDDGKRRVSLVATDGENRVVLAKWRMRA